jgi:hypothetical protein
MSGSASGPGVASPPDEVMMWEVLQHHANHFHPYLDPTIGNNLQLQAAPSPEDFLASTNSYLEVILSVTNDIGLTTTVSRNVMPLTTNVMLDSVPSGLPILVDDFEVSTPVTIVTWQNHQLKLEAKFLGSTSDLEWLGWSNGGDQTQFVTIPKGNSSKPLLFRAIYQSTLSPTLSSSIEPSAAPNIEGSSAPSIEASSAPSIEASSTPSAEMPTSSSVFQQSLSFGSILGLALLSVVV